MKPNFFGAMAAGLLASAAFGASAHAACPAVTVADMGGLESAFPQQFELAEFEAAASCELSFAENPGIAELNARIVGNADLPPVEERLPTEPLVVAPYQGIGVHGGVLEGLSKATEAGTSDLLSVRHVNFARYSDDLTTLVPNVATGWTWNDDFTELTIGLRDGHKWSDGAPFTAHDVVFWYHGLLANPEIYESIPERFTAGGEPFVVEAVDDQTVKITLAAPKPGLMSIFAVDYAQPFQARHFFGRWHPEIDENAQANAEADGFESWADAINFYYGGSDWTDVPTPLLKDPALAEGVGRMVRPSLESHVVVADTTEGRRLVANPYFHQVDTAGNQLPYISEINERYVPELEIQNLMLANGEVTYKQQAISAEDLPVLQANEEKGGYSLDLRPTIGRQVVYAFNPTHKNEAMRAIFLDRRFREAASIALNREEINELVYFSLGQPMQYAGFDPTSSFVTDEQRAYLTEHDPERAMALLDEMGVVDADGDGKRDLPNGEQLVIDLVFSSQGGAVRERELVAQYWNDIGLDVRLKEVTSDEYRASQAANDLDIATWPKGDPAVVVANNRESFVPPFDEYFSLTYGHAWDEWIKSEGASGIEPPASIAIMDELSAAYQIEEPGSEAQLEIASQLVDAVQENFFEFGTVGGAASPIYRSNDLMNFQPFTLKAYEYYWTYPYRASQWHIAQ